MSTHAPARPHGGTVRPITERQPGEPIEGRPGGRPMEPVGSAEPTERQAGQADPMSDLASAQPHEPGDPMSPDLAELFRWRAEGGGTWTDAAGQASRLLAEVEAGRMDATPAELAGLRAFVATVEGMSGA
jgi:hypothetical protein